MVDAAMDEVRTLLRALAVATQDESWNHLTVAAAEHRIEPPADSTLWEERLRGAGAVFAAVSARLAGAVDVDAVGLLWQRAALRGLQPQGVVSAGGGSRLLRTRDGWVAVSLARKDDWELIPALLGADCSDWDALEAAARSEVATDLADRAGELGLAVAVLPEADEPADPQWVSRRTGPPSPWVITRPSPAHPGRPLRRVVDMSALWAGPLCASLLRQAGAAVVTVESTMRPDGARRGDPELHRVLHAGNDFVGLDFTDPGDLARLHGLIDDADVVVSSARVRALQHLGLDPFEIAARHPGVTWVGISAYGLTGPWSNRVGYGDDAAVAGGLVIRGATPAFFADAAADPVTGLYAAIAALAVAASGGGVVDAALRDAAAHLARPVDQSAA